MSRPCVYIASHTPLVSLIGLEIKWWWLNYSGTVWQPKWCFFTVAMSLGLFHPGSRAGVFQRFFDYILNLVWMSQNSIAVMGLLYDPEYHLDNNGNGQGSRVTIGWMPRAGNTPHRDKLVISFFRVVRSVELNSVINAYSLHLNV